MPREERPSRRMALAGLLAIAVNWAAVPGTDARKKRKKRLGFNQFGCLDVGAKCYGKDALCCSGICEGPKAKSRCVGHHVGGCQAGAFPGSCGGSSEFDSCPDGPASLTCFTTTGNAGFCGHFYSHECSDCVKDADCPGDFGPAACVLCPGDCAGTGGRACVPFLVSEP